MTLNWNIGENRIKKNQTSTINFHISLIYHISLLRYISYEKIISIVLFQVSSHPFSIPPWRVPNSSLLLMGKGWWTAVYMKNKQVNIPNLLEGWKTGINSWLFYLLHETKRSLKDDTTHWSVNGPFSWKWNQRMSKKTSKYLYLTLWNFQSRYWNSYFWNFYWCVGFFDQVSNILISIKNFAVGTAKKAKTLNGNPVTCWPIND